MNDKDLRELDAWVGVNIFGMKPIHRDGPKPTKGTEDDYFIVEWVNISGSLPHYSTDPAAAMQVLEKCHEICCVETGIYENISGSIRGNFARSVYRDITIEAKTLPIAICLFAKKLFSKP